MYASRYQYGFADAIPSWGDFLYTSLSPQRKGQNASGKQFLVATAFCTQIFLEVS
jgi:hypothetical protein